MIMIFYFSQLSEAFKMFSHCHIWKVW